MNLQERGRRGGRARAAGMTPEARSASARKAVQARWAKRARRDASSLAIPTGSRYPAQSITLAWRVPGTPTARLIAWMGAAS